MYKTVLKTLNNCVSKHLWKLMNLQISGYLLDVDITQQGSS